MDALTEQDIIVFDSIGDLPQNTNFQTEAYILLLCCAGKASCRLGEKVYEIGHGDLFLCQPKTFVENAMTSLDFSCQGIIISVKFFESILFLSGKIWDAKFVVRENPVIHLTDDELELAIRNNNFIRSKLEAPHLPHFKEMLRLLLQSFAYESYDMFIPKLQLSTHSYTSAENLFSRFMDMAATEIPRQREVRYYADRLCITPKYLSTVCKQTSGNTASAILNGLTVDYIKRELRTSDKSVKEIANEAGFANLSFFGKYVKRELGVSPREYRSKYQDI